MVAFQAEDTGSAQAWRRDLDVEATREIPGGGFGSGGSGVGCQGGAAGSQAAQWVPGPRAHICSRAGPAPSGASVLQRYF